jgi:hypothetical protein
VVLPPTRLTHLLRSTEFTPEAIVATLSANGCLTLAARARPAAVRKLIAGVLVSGRRGPPVIGPSTTDRIARALSDSPFLSVKGRRFYDNLPDAPWYQRWLDAIRSLWQHRSD